MSVFTPKCPNHFRHQCPIRTDTTVRTQPTLVSDLNRFLHIMIDIDDFKRVNDTYGHQAGDSVIKKLVEILLKLIRSSDRMGRWGGEEFVVLLPQTAYSQAFELAQRLRVGFSTYKFENIGYKTASFGVATLEENDTMSSLIDKSDKALYISKNLGKNRVS